MRQVDRNRRSRSTRRWRAMMKTISYCLVLAAAFLQPLSVRAQENGTNHSRLAFLKPHPARVLRFVAHHKYFLITSTVLIAADAAYTRSTLDMQHRCPQCIGFGNPRAAAAATGAFIAMNYYVTTKVPGHRVANDIALSILTGYSAYWLGRAASDYSSVDNPNDLNNVSFFNVGGRRGLILHPGYDPPSFSKVLSDRR